MKEGPDISRIASLIGDPARANMLNALMSGYALTVGELAFEARISLSTASGHLSKLREAGLIIPRKQGRHRYFSLAEDVPQLLEHLTCVAANHGHLRAQPGPKDPALRRCRVCFDHLAGASAVRLYMYLHSNHLICGSADEVSHLTLSPKGEVFCKNFSINVDVLKAKRRPMCLPCLDWSERKTHLAGALGAAFLERFIVLGWVSRDPDTRILHFSQSGEKAFNRVFG